MKTKIQQKIQLTIYKYTWLPTLAMLFVITYYLINGLSWAFLYAQPWTINFAINEKIKEILYYIYLIYYFVKPLFNNISDIVMTLMKLLLITIKYVTCAIHLTLYLVKQHIQFLIVAGKHGYGFMWGHALTNIEFTSVLIKNLIYYICEALTILFLIILRIEILGIAILLMTITTPYFVIIYVVKLWLSLNINISLFTFLFIIIPFGIRVYYDQWKMYWIDIRQNSDIYVYDYHGYYDYHEDNDIAKFLENVFYPFLFYKIGAYIYTISWKLILVLKIWLKILLISGLVLIASLNFALFIIYLSIYNLAFKYFIEFPIISLRKKWGT